jgi:hypothetical protein
MKKTIILAICSILIVAASIFACFFLASKKASADAIIAVFNKAKTDFQAYSADPGNDALRVLSRKMNSYDTTACPKAFQEAWIDYGTAWTELSNLSDRQVADRELRQRRAHARAFVDAVSIVATHGAGLLLAGAHAAKDAANQTADAGEQDNGRDSDKILESGARCKKIAIEYGVAFGAKK